MPRDQNRGTVSTTSLRKLITFAENYVNVHHSKARFGIQEPPALTTCIECGEPASVSLPCGNAVCEGCWERYGPTGCSTCDGHATWCTFAK